MDPKNIIPAAIGAAVGALGAGSIAAYLVYNRSGSDADSEHVVGTSRNMRVDDNADELTPVPESQGVAIEKPLSAGKEKALISPLKAIETNHDVVINTALSKAKSIPIEGVSKAKNLAFKMQVEGDKGKEIQLNTAESKLGTAQLMESKEKEVLGLNEKLQDQEATKGSTIVDSAGANEPVTSSDIEATADEKPDSYFEATQAQVEIDTETENTRRDPCDGILHMKMVYVDFEPSEAQTDIKVTRKSLPPVEQTESHSIENAIINTSDLVQQDTEHAELQITANETAKTSCPILPTAEHGGMQITENIVNVEAHDVEQIKESIDSSLTTKVDEKEAPVESFDGVPEKSKTKSGFFNRIRRRSSNASQKSFKMKRADVPVEKAETKDDERKVDNKD